MDLEELLVQEGVAAPPEHIRRALRLSQRDGRHPVEALVGEGVVGEDVLADLLARAAGTVVVDLDDGKLDADASRAVSGPTARRHLVVPVAAPAAGKLRVAFVNPLDAEALRDLEEGTRLTIQPVVGTLSGVCRAIEAIYAGQTTRVVGDQRSEMTSEITRRVFAPSPEETAPLHRLEQEATIEQRHEALLLALVERGVLTHADYVEALKRLLSGRRGE